MHLAGLQQRAVGVSGGGHPSDQSGFVAPIFEGHFVRLVLTKVVKMQLLSISHVSVITFPSLIVVVLGRRRYVVFFFFTRGSFRSRAQLVPELRQLVHRTPEAADTAGQVENSFKRYAAAV